MMQSKDNECTHSSASNTTYIRFSLLHAWQVMLIAKGKALRSSLPKSLLLYGGFCHPLGPQKRQPKNTHILRSPRLALRVAHTLCLLRGWGCTLMGAMGLYRLDLDHYLGGEHTLGGHTGANCTKAMDLCPEEDFNEVTQCWVPGGARTGD